MLQRLINLFINATKDKCTKRGVEWVMADFIYAVYIIIMLFSMCLFISCGIWYSILATAVLFMLLMSGWGWFAFHLRKTLLTLLYPQDENVDENGDSLLTSEFDILNQTLTKMMKDYEKLKED